MFERYTEHARRVIFFARYEASQFGAPYIEPEHLLLGVLRERASVYFLVPASLTLDGLRRELEATLPRREKTSTSVDLPLSHKAKRILAYGTEEAEKLQAAHIGPQHLLLGMLREETLASAMLRKHGVELEDLRKKLGHGAHVLAGGAEDPEVLAELRKRFSALVEQLTHEIEPAAVYRLRPRDEETE